MYYEFYIDRYFAEQFFVDFLLLNAAAVFCREKRNVLRLTAGSLAGAFASSVSLYMGKPEFALAGLAAASALGFWKKELRIQWRRNLFFSISVLFLTVCFGGVFEALVSLATPSFLAGTAISFAFLRMGLWLCRGVRSRTENLAAVKLTLEGRTVELEALVDTGNRLRAPFTGRPVSIVNRKSLAVLLDEDYLERKGFCMIPYHSLGVGTGWMKGIVPDEMTVSTAESRLEVKDPLIALYEGGVSAREGWQMILHPEHAP